MSTQTFKLEIGEQIILEKRKHWFEYVGPFAGGIFNAALPFIIFVVVGSKFSAFTENVPGNVWYLFGMLYALWLLFLSINIAIFFTNIYLDVLVVTNRRIIDIEQKGLFSRIVSSVRFDRIQDITVEVHGIIPTLLNFGTLRIQTAGDEKEFIVRNINAPYAAKDFVMREHHRAVEERHASANQVGGVA